MPLVVYRHEHCLSIWVTPSHSMGPFFVLSGIWGRKTRKEGVKSRREGGQVLVEIEMTLGVIHEIPSDFWQEIQANVLCVF